MTGVTGMALGVTTLLLVILRGKLSLLSCCLIQFMLCAIMHCGYALTLGKEPLCKQPFNLHSFCLLGFLRFSFAWYNYLFALALFCQFSFVFSPSSSHIICTVVFQNMIQENKVTSATCQCAHINSFC